MVKKTHVLGESLAIDPAVQTFFVALENLSATEDHLLKVPPGTKWPSRGDYRPIHVRQCYGEMHNKMQQILRRKESKGNIIVAGAPGIGKWFFALCWLFRAVKEGRTVMYEVGARSTIDYYARSSGSLSCGTNGSGPPAAFDTARSDPNAIYLVDSRSDPTHYNRCSPIRFSCPREKNFHDFRKHGACILRMSLCGLDELEECRERVHGAHLAKDYVITAIGVLGRVPRYVLEFTACLSTWNRKAAQNGEVCAALGN